MNLTVPHGVVLSLKPPTARQREILMFIHSTTLAHGIPPTGLVALGLRPTYEVEPCPRCGRKS
jgi:hypothetical protein